VAVLPGDARGKARRVDRRHAYPDLRQAYPDLRQVAEAPCPSRDPGSGRHPLRNDVARHPPDAGLTPRRTSPGKRRGACLGR